MQEQTHKKDLLHIIANGIVILEKYESKQKETSLV